MTKKSEKQAKSDPHRTLPSKVANIPYNKFIALPDGLRIKSPITGVETENTSPRKPVPLKAVPLPSGGIDYDEYTGDIGVTTTVTNHAETDEFVRPGRTLHRRSGSQSSAGSVNGSLSSVPSSDASQFTPRGFYRKRSQSTPPDIGRQRNSPVDRRIGKLVNQYYNSLNNNNIELIGDPGISDYNSNWNYDDISSTHSSLDIEDYGDVFDYDVTSKQCHKSNTFEDIPTGHSFIMHPHYLTLPRNTQFSNVVYSRGEGGGESLKSNSMRGRPQLSLAHTNGTLPRGNGVLVYKPSNTSEVIMMGNYPANHNGYIPGNNNLPVEDKQKSSLSLFKSRAKSASMPTLLDTNSKDYKKFLKEVKRQEKEEKKRLEKEERRRIKEEKKRRKAFEKEQKQKIKTLPRNWNYVNRPIESVYARPRLSLSAVPIDFEDGPAASYRSTPPPSVAPPPPPQPSLRTRAIYSSAPDLLRLEQVYGATIRGQVPQGRVPLTNGIYSNYVSDYAPRTVVLQRGPEGYGFVLRGAKSQSKTAAELDFHPTPEFPALQYLDSVDPGSKADRAGLKGGDFILEINGENVVRASHDRVVQIIRQSGDTLALKVVTVKPISKPDHWLQHQDGSMTLPSRTSKKPAPQPPQRDPQTSLSVSKADGKHIAEGMAELERIAKTSSPDELDLALAQYETQEVPVVTSEQKTASIRAKHSAKRVSCVELENIVTDDQQKAKDYMSPSEMRIKKYHKKQNGGMERANSNPDLLSDGKRSEPVYATPGGNVKSEHKRSGSIGDTSRHTYAIPGDLPNGDNVSLRSSISSGSGSRLQSPSTERPKGAPPAPPNGNSVPKRPAPQPPPGVDPVAPAKSELVSISTNRKSVNVTEIKVNKSTTDSEYESSFRPGISAHLTNEPKVVTASVEQAKLKSHSRNTSVGSNKSSESQGSNKVTAPVDQDKPSVSFAEDKVYDSAKSFLQKHPNAQLLVTADIHGDTLKNKRKSSSYEPEPDYDADSDNDKLDSNKSVTQTKNSVTVISVGDTSTPKATSKQQYTISRSDIPSAKSGDDMVIPPPPSEPAPKPPSPKLNTSKPPSPKLGQTTKQEERRSSVDISPKTSPAPPPPAPPPPPVAPPVPTAPPPPASEQKVEEVKPMASLVAKGLPTEDILAAVAQRKARIDTGEIRMSEQPEKAKTTETWKKKFDETHNALLAAVAKRRSVLATTDEHAVVDQIESKLQKTKKLQAVKMYFGSDTSDKKETEKKDEEKKSETNASSASKGATPVKIDIAPATSVKKTAPVKTPVKTGVTPLKIEIASASSAKPNNTSTNVRKVSEDKTKTSTGGNTSNVKSSTTQQKSTAPKTPDKPANENKGNSSTTPTTNAQEKSTDFVAMAEKARQEWLQKKASSSSLKINTTTTTTSNGVSNKSPKSPPASQTTAKMNGTVTPTKSVTSITSISTKSTSSTKTSTQQTDKKSNNKGLTPMKSDRDSDVISKTTSIRDRIKNFEKTDSDSNGNLQSPGSSVSSSPDRKKSSTLPPPPPGFGDAVHIDIIPPPSGFNYDEGKHSGDSESVVSSVSTLSTLSDEHGDSGFGRQKHSYEDLIPPPPPGFDDNSDQSYEVIPSVIPPPPEFGGSSLNSISKPARTNKPFLAKPVDNWQCLDVLDWLDSLNMTQYKDSFQKHCINGKKLMGLTRNDYIELGVTQVGHRMNLERSIKKAAIRRNSGVES